MQDRQPGAPGQYILKISTDEVQKLLNSEECTVVLTRDDQPIVEGTPLNKASFLPDELASELCPDIEDPTPADALRQLSTNIANLYDVGDIYISTNSTSPAIRFGGTWEQLKDTFLLAAGDTYIAGETGGEATHTLTIEEMPSHNHPFAGSDAFSDYTSASLFAAGTAYPNSPSVYVGADWSSAGHISLQNTGGGQPHNNMPPYFTVYMWKRVA